MNQKILVAYASKHGATAEIAERIGEVLQEKGFDVTVQSAKINADLKTYDKVILGIALYYGRYQKDAVHFLKEQVETLATLPVWIFLSGPTGTEDPNNQLKGWLYPDSLKPVIEQIKPQQITCFGGKIDLDQLSFIEKGVINKVKSPIGDFRNWDSIVSWAESIASTE